MSSELSSTSKKEPAVKNKEVRFVRDRETQIVYEDTELSFIRLVAY